MRSIFENADLSHCTWSGYDADGFLGIQPDVFGRGMTPFHHLSPAGLDHRPQDPDGNVGELAIRWSNGAQGFILPLNDLRTEPALPNLNKGATRLFDTGTYKGHPFHFTATLDPVSNEGTLDAHREGGKWIIKNQEGVRLEISGTTVKITGAASIEFGDAAQAVAIAALVSAQLTLLLTAIQTAATSEAQASGMGGTTALAAQLAGWPQSVAATILKGQ